MGRFGEGAHFGGSGYTLVGNNLGITGGTITMTGWVKMGTAPVSGTYYTRLETGFSLSVISVE